MRMIYVLIAGVVWMLMGYAAMRLDLGGAEWLLVYFNGAVIFFFAIGWGMGTVSDAARSHWFAQRQERQERHLQESARVAGHP